MFGSLLDKPLVVINFLVDCNSSLEGCIWPGESQVYASTCPHPNLSFKRVICTFLLWKLIFPIIWLVLGYFTTGNSCKTWLRLLFFKYLLQSSPIQTTRTRMEQPQNSCSCIQHGQQGCWSSPQGKGACVHLPQGKLQQLLWGSSVLHQQNHWHRHLSPMSVDQDWEGRYDPAKASTVFHVPFHPHPRASLLFPFCSQPQNVSVPLSSELSAITIWCLSDQHKGPASACASLIGTCLWPPRCFPDLSWWPLPGQHTGDLCYSPGGWGSPIVYLHPPYKPQYDFIYRMELRDGLFKHE